MRPEMVNLIIPYCLRGGLGRYGVYGYFHYFLYGYHGYLLYGFKGMYDPRAMVPDHIHHGLDMFRGSTTTSANNIHQTFFGILLDLGGHLFGGLIIFAKSIGQSCIGMGRNGMSGLGGQYLQMGH